MELYLQIITVPKRNCSCDCSQGRKNAHEKQFADPDAKARDEELARLRNLMRFAARRSPQLKGR